MAARLNLLILSLAVHFASSAVVISEVADKGSSSQCGAGNEDWVELHNAGSASVSLAGWKLHDDKGPSDSKAFTFSSTTPLAAGEYLLLCTRMDDAATSPQFKIGGDDTVTLLDASGAVVSSTGALQDLGELDLTWAYNAATSSWRYTSTPTPGQANVFTDSWPALRARLTKQHDDGEAFFEASHITIAAGRLPPVVEVRLTLSAEDWAFQLANVSYEVYKPFTGLTVTSGDGSVTHATLANGGRARPRGQSTMAIPACLGLKTFPWLIDVASGADKTQRLFGMEKFYLRNHLGDHSHMRDWTMHRMLRMHGMPYLRTRTAKLYINAVFVGTYSLMESADQDYVFYRNFGQGDANSPSSLPPFAPGHALYKIKTQSRNCGKYETRGSGGKDSVANAQPPIYTAPTDPSLYAFKRGEHRQKVAVHVGDDMTKCLPEFYGMIIREERDAIAAWLKNGKDCGEMVIENGLVDRDFGGSNTANDNDGRMKSFFNTYLADGAADGCGGACDSDDNAGGNIYAQLRSTPKVNVDDLLKNFAVYAVTVGMDSPIGIGNNYFLANPGGDTAAERAYRMVQYDHNNVAEGAGMDLCAPECKGRAVYWSIARPTCKALSSNPLVGPLLSGPGNADNMRKYLQYVKDFVDNVYTNAQLITEFETHASAIASAVKADPMISSGGQYYYTETIASAGSWEWFKLLAFMKKRGEEVKKQLEALDAGTFPRGGDGGSDGSVPASETCQDWRLEQTPGYVFEANSKTCPSSHKDCSLAFLCFDETEKGLCDALTGQFTDRSPLGQPGAMCTALVDQYCRPCFPYSVCGVKKPSPPPSPGETVESSSIASPPSTTPPPSLETVGSEAQRTESSAAHHVLSTTVAITTMVLSTVALYV